MISSGIRNLIQLFIFFLVLNIIFAVYEPTHLRRYPAVSNNQRSADSGYKYAWFTRDIHDDVMNDEEKNLREEQLSPQRLLRLNMIKSIYNRKYPNHDETFSESNEKL